MDEPLRLPLRPNDNSIQSHLLALDLLSARLAALPSSTRWAADVPLNSKATVRGQLIHTNEIKVHLGGEWWVEMTADEAAAYVRRRRHALLEEHARMTDGGGRIPGTVDASRATAPGDVGSLPTISFNPLFSASAIAGPSRGQRPSESRPSPEAQPATQADISKQVEERQKRETSSVAAPARHVSSAMPAQAEPTSLEDVLEEFVQKQQQLTGMSGNAKGKGKMLQALQDGTVTNEEGLPFHEIRELPDGSTIGALPPSTTDGSGVKEEDAEEYWSETARQRREALRRRIFNEGSETEEDDAASSDEESPSALPADATPTPPPEPAVPSIINAPPSPPSSPSPPASPAHGTRRPSSGVLPGKSILKPPARKKSVSFDESVPPPPDSPDLLGGKKTMGFPLPSTDANEFDPNPVPVINAPRLPGGRDQPFAGFKKGFLGTPRASGVEKISEPAAVVEPEAAKPRKTSLFAQRLAQQTVKESAPVPSPVASRDVAGMPQSPSTGTSEPKTAVSLPKLSETKPMASMKSAVVENPPDTKPPPSNTPAPVRRDVSEHQPGHDDFEDDDDDLDEEEDEDEYDLDDALLAREVALEYHRRRAYARLNPDQDQDGNVMSVEGEGEEGGGDVMLALPQVDASGRPMIVNPTPDDIRRFVRVGRLQNGNLVLAPGEQGWSEDEEDVDAEEKELRRQRRAEVKRQLLGADPAQSAIPGPRVQEREEQPVQLPPTIVTEKERPTAAVGEVKESLPKVIEVEQPKKVSRFKQARMAAGHQ